MKPSARTPDPKAWLATIVQACAKLKPALRGFAARLRDVEGNNFRLGCLHMERGNLADAAFRFMLITRLNPKHGEAWRKLAEVEEKRGRSEKAKAALHHAKRLGF